MILEDDPNDDGIVEAIAEATQEAELEHILEIEEENKGVLANISMPSKMSQESGTESATETYRLRAVQSHVSTHLCNCIKMFQNYKDLKILKSLPKSLEKCFGLITSLTVFFRMKNYMCNKMRKAAQFLQEKSYKKGILFVLMKANFVHIKSCTKENRNTCCLGQGVTY